MCVAAGNKNFSSFSIGLLLGLEVSHNKMLVVLLFETVWWIYLRAPKSLAVYYLVFTARVESETADLLSCQTGKIGQICFQET